MTKGESFQTPESRRTTTRHIYALTIWPGEDDLDDAEVLKALKEFGSVTLKRYFPREDEFRSIT